MLLLGPSRSTEQDVWTAQADLPADVEDVLLALTDPDLIASWAPVQFDVDGLADGRLRAGCRERVHGSLVGVTTSFDVEVARADSDRFELVARGPVSFDVAYRFRPQLRGVRVEASVSLRQRGGLAAQLVRTAVAAALNAGALGAALRRLDAALSCELDGALLGA
jgi:Polyketide cyclase / dehydrase and lipid transport